MFADLGHRDPVGEGAHRGQGHPFPGGQRLLQAVGVLGLDADDTDFRPQVFHIGGDPGDQPTAAHRDEDRIQRPLLLAQDFHGHCALPGDHMGIVERRYEGAPAALGQLQGMGQGEGKAGAVQQRVTATAAHPQDLELRGGLGHDDGGLDPQLPRRQGHALGMIAGGGGDHPALLLLAAQLREAVVGAADLEGKGRLQVLALEQDLVAQVLGQRRRRLQRRADGQVIDRRGKNHLHIALQQGHVGTRSGRWAGAAHDGSPGCVRSPGDREKKPASRAGWVQSSASPPMSNGGNNAWLGTNGGKSHGRKTSEIIDLSQASGKTIAPAT